MIVNFSTILVRLNHDHGGENYRVTRKKMANHTSLAKLLQALWLDIMLAQLVLFIDMYVWAQAN